MTLIDLLNLVFVLLVSFSIFKFARAAQQKRENEQAQNEPHPTDKRKHL